MPRWLPALSLLAAVACSNAKPAKGPQVDGVAREDAAASAASTSDAATATPTTLTLDAIVANAQKEFHAAADDAAVDAIAERWARVLADERSITDDDIRAELERRKQYLRDLHAGDRRVYPDKGTMNAMLGVPALLERALSLRAQP